MIFTDKNDKNFSFGSKVVVKVGGEYIGGTVVPAYEIQLDRATSKGVKTVGSRTSGAKNFITVSGHCNGPLANKN